MSADTFDAGSWVDAAIKARQEPWAVVTHDNRHIWAKEIDIDCALQPPPLLTSEQIGAAIDEFIRRGRVTYAEHLVGGAPSV